MKTFDLTTPAMERAAEIHEATRRLRVSTPNFIDQANKLAAVLAAAAATSPEAAEAIRTALLARQ